MRNVIETILALVLTTAPGQAERFAQVINGEGNFESNRGFDHAPGEESSVDKPAKPEPSLESPRQR